MNGGYGCGEVPLCFAGGKGKLFKNDKLIIVRWIIRIMINN